MIDGITFVVLALGAFRITRLIVVDTILDDAREATVGRLDPDGKLAELFGCPWCIGFWICIVIAIIWMLAPINTERVMLPFALSAIVGLVATNLE